MAVGEEAGQQAIIALLQENGAWIPHSIVRVDVTHHGIVRVADYAQCPLVQRATTFIVVEPS